MALTNMDFKTKNWSHVGEEQTVKRGKERRREEEEEEEKKRKKMEEPKRYGTLDFVWITWNCKALYG